MQRSFLPILNGLIFIPTQDCFICKPHPTSPKSEAATNAQPSFSETPIFIGGNSKLLNRELNDERSVARDDAMKHNC